MEYKGKDFSYAEAQAKAGSSSISEMAIVDAFTKLIFGDENDYGTEELLVIAAFRGVEHSVIQDTYSEMGAYLQNLGVREMIELVGQVKVYLQEPAVSLAALELPTSKSTGVRWY